MPPVWCRSVEERETLWSSTKGARSDEVISYGRGRARAPGPDQATLRRALAQRARGVKPALLRSVLCSSRCPFACSCPYDLHRAAFDA